LIRSILASKSEAPKTKAGSTKPAFESADQEDTVDSKEHLSVVFVGYISKCLKKKRCMK
jgi:hypothetical protein